MPVKNLLKRVVSEGGRQRVRRLGRLRWVNKYRRVGAEGGRRLTHWRYILWSPEVDSFTYPIANEDELADALAVVLGTDRARVAEAIAEAHTCPVLRRALRQRWPQIIWVRRDPDPVMPHLASWAVLRITRPALAVETGILDGMASTVMLAALERNAREGHEGRLLSVDVMPGAGTMVPDWLRGRWERVTGDSATVLPQAIGDRRVGWFVSDSLIDAAHVDRELQAVLAHREPGLAVMTVSGVLDSLDRAGAHVVRVQERPVGHFYAGRRIAIARFD